MYVCNSWVDRWNHMLVDITSVRMAFNTCGCHAKKNLSHISLNLKQIAQITKQILVYKFIGMYFVSWFQIRVTKVKKKCDFSGVYAFRVKKVVFCGFFSYDALFVSASFTGFHKLDRHCITHDLETNEWLGILGNKCFRHHLFSNLVYNIRLCLVSRPSMKSMSTIVLIRCMHAYCTTPLTGRVTWHCPILTRYCVYSPIDTQSQNIIKIIINQGAMESGIYETRKRQCCVVYTSSYCDIHYATGNIR